MSSTHSNALIVADHLTKFYGQKLAIEAVCFEIFENQIMGFLGPNGAGKSTTLRILTGLMNATSGKAYMAGISVARFPEKIGQILGYLHENNPLPEDVSVENYLTYRGTLKGLSGKPLQKRVDEVLSQCGLEYTFKNVFIRDLSKGYRQRVGIAEALIHKPRILILDEPTIGLDPHQVIRFRELIRELKNSMTLLISSHLLTELETIIDEAMIINHGHIIANGSIEKLQTLFIKNTTYHLEIIGDESIVKTVIASVCIDTPWKLTTKTLHHWILTVEDTQDLSLALIKAILATPALSLLNCCKESINLEKIFIEATQRHSEKISTTLVASLD